MRAAIYARYSSDLQSASSIADQVHLCRDTAKRQGWRVGEVYSDAAISGGSLRSRPAMLDLLEAARSGDFEILLAEALDRISRDQEDIAAIYKRLIHAGVRLVTLAEGEINELHVGLKGTMNALYIKDLAQKTRRGQRGCVEAGRIPGGKSYGYRIVRRLLENGEASTGEREIEPAEAAVVQRIFAEYCSGLSPRRIAARLNAEGIPGPRGGPWNASTINGSRQRRNGILNNELYIGRITYNRQRFIKDPETGKRTSRPNPEQEWVTAEIPELRIVDQETWQKAQRLKARYASRAGNKRQTRKRLLTDLVRCGACGGAMTIVSRERYYCSAKRERGTCESAVGIKAEELEQRILKGLEDILLGREDLVDLFVEAFHREMARLQKDQASQSVETRKALTKVETAIARCLKFITEGDGDPGLVRDELTRLEAERAALTRKLETAAPPKLALHPNLPELYRRKVTELQSLLTDEQTRAEAHEVIRSLIDRVEVHAGERRGKADVVLVGALARILEFASPQSKTAASGGDGGRVLLVAGAGFEPATFRL